MSTRPILRPRRERPCNWPHAMLSAEEEQELTGWIVRYRPFMAKVAWFVSYHRRQVAMDLEQESMILLWRMGAARIARKSVRYMLGAIVRRMLKVLESERRQDGGSLTTVAHLRKAA
jgi:hypothetical protein